MCHVMLFYALISTKIILIGCDVENISDRRKSIMLANVCAAMRIFGVFFGVISFKTYRPKVDYSKWLGPDWKPHYDGASMYVSNHTSWYEMFLTFLFVRPMPGFVAKHSVKDVPSVGPIATAVGTVFMSRNSNDDR